jgi:NitT/TauT family transport system ATP-binding protein
MDEPFASVDALTKIHLEQLLLRIWTETPFTCVFVTHDIEEAVYLADRLFVLSPRPSRLRKEIVVDLPRPRDPVTTKALPEFQRLREQAFNLIEGAISSEA